MGCKDIGVRKLEFVAKTQFLCFIIQLCVKSELEELRDHKVVPVMSPILDLLFFVFFCLIMFEYYLEPEFLDKPFIIIYMISRRDEWMIQIAKV